ncbi:MAG: hypothetical protein KBA71_08580 [Opitutaceae bacterium]|nr:hypothetical protein [Opitutaceae bacterium]
MTLCLVTGANAGELQDRIVVVLQISDVTTTLEAVVGKSSRNIFCQARENNAGMSAHFVLSLPAGVSGFRLNIGWTDVDRPENTKPSMLWWRPPEVSAFGQFSIDD